MSWCATDINDFLIKMVNVAVVVLRDVARTRRLRGVRKSRSPGWQSAVRLTLSENRSVSTLEIVDQIRKDLLPKEPRGRSPGLEIKGTIRQSICVRRR